MIRYDMIEEFNVDSKAECDELNAQTTANETKAWICYSRGLLCQQGRKLNDPCQDLLQHETSLTRKPSQRQVSARQPCVYEDLFLSSHCCLMPPS